jgi:hypothetical protein
VRVEVLDCELKWLRVIVRHLLSFLCRFA